ncbi:unnamed protein product [Clavelina lepadiformis]|uniref:Hydantoinase B/oxoprolinase domain-containing protein n=1 Tax=Clavelina lepadiformis TaxID=159417 RepID=A0ABP0G6H0_CLALP
MNRQERLDFSCALFGPDGGLVSNASHISGHLGAMQDAVQYQMRAIEVNEGDGILSNHPSAGGVHLPDLIGFHLVQELISSSGLEVLQAYMAHTPRRGPD